MLEGCPFNCLFIHITNLPLKSGVPFVPSQNFQLLGSEELLPLHIIIPPTGIDVST
jgi:hypothetical protein